MFLTAPAHADEPQYEAGQVWQYHAAAIDSDSLLKIQEVDQIGPNDDPMIVYHISVIGIAIPGTGDAIDMAHLPVSAETLDASATKLVDSDSDFPDYREGKAQWQAANGGVFTITVREIVEILREQFVAMRINQTPN